MNERPDVFDSQFVTKKYAFELINTIKKVNKSEFDLLVMQKETHMPIVNSPYHEDGVIERECLKRAFDYLNNKKRGNIND